MSSCADGYTVPHTGLRLECGREAGHHGDHQVVADILGFRALFTWSATGSTRATVRDGDLLIRCSGCGARIVTKPGDTTVGCRSCRYWADQLAAGDSVVENGVHYRIGDGTGPFLGFDGRVYRITFDGGRVVETNDLTHQGAVPGHLRDRMPDNARIEEIARRLKAAG